MNTELLLEPVSAAQPTGENLEYHADFSALERAAEGRPEQQMGSAVVAGEPPNHALVIELGTELLGRSKDLRIAMRVARASLERAGLRGLAEGLSLVRGLIERYWESLFPELDPDDGDATMRLSALSALVSPDLLSAVRAAPLLVSQRFGPISLRDVAIASGDLPPTGGKPELDADVISGCFREADLSVLQALLAVLQAARADLSAIRTALETGSGNPVPDFTPLERLLYQARGVVTPYVERRQAEAAPAVEAKEPPPEGAVPSIPAEVAGLAQQPAAILMQNGPPPAGAWAIRNRDDVVRLLDEICEYYARHEPSSPLPLLLARCRRLAALSFIEIVKDLAPDALSHVQLVAGRTED